MADSFYFKADNPLPDTPPQGERPGPYTKTNVLSTSRPRVDAKERVCGQAVYPSDIRLHGMLHAAILGSPHANARLTGLDLSKARAMPGVRAVIGPDDPLADLNWDHGDGAKARLFRPELRYEGEAVAAVCADTPWQAWDAIRAIEASYDVLPHVSDERTALDDGAPKVAPDGNLVSNSDYERGSVQQGFAEADAVVERDFRTACELHTPLELHGATVRWDGEELTVWESTQGVYSVQQKLAEVLGLPLASVRVIGHYMGGGFGSKLETSKYSVIAALLAKKTGRPVRLFLTREQTYLTMGNRPPSNMHIKVGARKDGTLTAIEYTGLGASGAYPAGGAALLDWLAKDLYSCPNVKTRLTDVLVNANPARPFRAPGYPQCSWAVEQIMDELAEKLGMCPVALRLQNIPEVSQGREGQPAYTSTSLRQCIEEGARAFKWQESRKRTASQASGTVRRRGVGMAAANWFVGGGGPPSTVVLKLFADGSVNLNMGASDIGTGTKTVMAMVAAEELGVDPDSIQVENADTGTTQYATPSGGSKTVPTEAPTVRQAAVALKRELLQMAAEDLGLPMSELTFAGSSIKGGGKSVAVTELSRLKQQKVAMGVGHRGPNPEGKQVTPFAAQFCEVEVDTQTGEVAVLRLVAVNESGRIMNRLTFDNQIVGGVTMGIGLAATEARVLDAATGKLLNRNWHDYKLPTAMDAPLELTPVALQLPDHEANVSGAKGLGEPVTIPTAGAIANAVYDALGLRMTESPINPSTLAGRLPLAGRTKES